MTTTPIKFRGFRTDNNEPVYGSLVQFTESILSIFVLKNGGHDVFHIHPSSLGMFTGLTDKNGNEIYGAIGEKGGDVVKVDKSHIVFGGSNTHIVSYVSQSARFHLIGTTYDNLHEGLHDLSGKNCSEIIGNQWEVDNGK